MTRRWLGGAVLLLTLAVGCSTPCGELADKVEECNATITRSDIDAKCEDDQAECVMSCLDSNDCGRGPSYSQCVRGCGVH